MSKKSPKNENPPENLDARPDFDASMAEIESLIEQIESGSIGLEEQLAAYERGAGLLRSCRKLLDQAEQRVMEIEATGRGLEESSEGTDEA